MYASLKRICCSHVRVESGEGTGNVGSKVALIVEQKIFSAFFLRAKKERSQRIRKKEKKTGSFRRVFLQIFSTPTDMRTSTARSALHTLCVRAKRKNVTALGVHGVYLCCTHAMMQKRSHATKQNFPHVSTKQELFPKNKRKSQAVLMQVMHRVPPLWMTITPSLQSRGTE